MRKTLLAVAFAAAMGAAMAMEVPVARGQDGMALAALRIAYQREIDARQQYAAFAVRAEQEGYLGVRDLFTALSGCEEIHARFHELSLARMDVAPVVRPAEFVVDSTVGNLSTSFENELNERKAIYGRFMEYARAECLYDALARLRYARDAEASHARTLADAYFHLAEMRDSRAYFECLDCGALRGEAPTTSCDCGAVITRSRAVGPGPGPKARMNGPVASR